jgi:hypothetical protein
MSTVVVELATESHPAQHDVFGPYHYTFSRECLDRFAEQAVGLPVTVNFQGEPVGAVIGAERTADGVSLTLDVEGDPSTLVASPAFVASENDWSEDYSERVVRVADLKGIGLTDDYVEGARTDRAPCLLGKARAYFARKLLAGSQRLWISQRVRVVGVALDEMMLPKPRREARARWSWDCAPALPYPPSGSIAALAEGLERSLGAGNFRIGARA